MDTIIIFVIEAIIVLLCVIAGLAWRDHTDRLLERRPGFTGGPNREEQEETAQAATQAIDSLHGETWAG